jgi:hypothetical protein
MRGGRAKELARRSGSDGVEVSLRWRRADGRLTVVVTNQGAGESFSLPARRDNALDVFFHPYAYAGGSSNSAELSPRHGQDTARRGVEASESRSKEARR